MSQITLYWEKFAKSLKNDSSRLPELAGSFHFGGKEDATSISKLVISGTKKATASLLWVYEEENSPIPQIGEYNVITDSDGNPVCIIQTTHISVIPFNEVDHKFAFDCGEGDQTLKSWREMYQEYIQSECERIGRIPTSEIPLVCEYFKVVFTESL
ncbi:ASCH domain-containing protein [Chryseobacterium sp. Tr-659]|uniref:ASCH domain-containing protein n=1 Tax=Chryseobacterium sp. Tr-659 TaxID=2608340 RepID=UPI00142098C9|nr:ASCH domain-containing protein [Chryseobacterium sp. Tr-659]NIF06557.1 ASCH domain-containing protein [Chryseobacterium sp. Tr-659]